MSSNSLRWLTALVDQVELPYTWDDPKSAIPLPRSCSKSLRDLAEDKRLEDRVDPVAETAPLLPRWSVILRVDLARH
ncbi:hypothetical protein NDU88_005508 [Pleurodeles waltl]|uniref:Uncharacterized protein n=1 Tax=Pleurodeles waltl TaxID=8319 RepID=A0AAV7PIR3_PLEWA|nr:hypothetical protein NDU88_005508 [Pleurodeles waltl]